MKNNPIQPVLSEPLTDGERHLLAECEAVVDHGKQTFIEVGQALATIQRGRLYRGEDSNRMRTFEQYCLERFGFAKSQTYRLINAANIATELALPTGGQQMSPMGDAKLPEPTKERQTRELQAASTAENRLAAWKMAVEMAQGGDPTHQQVAEAVRRVQAASEPAEPAKPEPPRDQVGQLIPEHLVDVLTKGRRKFLDRLMSIRKERDAMKDLADSDIGNWLNRSATDTDLKNVWRQYKFAAPFAVCVYCKGRKGASCKGCGGRGWMPERVYRAASDEAKRLAGVPAPSELEDDAAEAA